MRLLAIVGAAVTVLLVMATFAMIYVAIWKDSGEWGASAYTTFILAVVTGGPTAFAWNAATS